MSTRVLVNGAGGNVGGELVQLLSLVATRSSLPRGNRKRWTASRSGEAAARETSSYVASDESGDALLRTAVLLAPGRDSGEDLLQEALERLLRKWPKVDGDPEGYLRRVLYNRAVDGWRRRSRRPEVLGLPTDSARYAVIDHSDRSDQRLMLIQALSRLTPRQRGAVVGRYWEQLSEAETAAALGCSVSAVKSAASRGLRALREAMAPEAGPLEPLPHLTERRKV